MSLRSCALTLLALLWAVAAAWADEPTGATVVLRLPPSMSPEAVRALMADLVAKVPNPTNYPASLPRPNPVLF